VAVRGPAVEAGAVEDVAAPPRAAHLGGGVEVAQADAAPVVRQRGRRERVEAHRRGVLIEALCRGGVVVAVVVVAAVGVEAGEAEQAGGEAAQVAEQEEEVEEQLGHLRVPDGEPHQHLPAYLVVLVINCQEREGLALPCLFYNSKEGTKQSRTAEESKQTGAKTVFRCRKGKT